MTEVAARFVPRAWPRLWAAAAVAVAVAVAVAAVCARALAYRGEALPGTHVAGVDLGGLDRAAASDAVQRVVGDALTRPVTVRVARTSLTVTPRTLFALDTDATLDRAIASGRGTELERVAALVGAGERDVQPVLVRRREAVAGFLRDLRRRGGRAPVPAQVTMHGVEPRVSQSRIGRRLRGDLVLADLRRAAFAGGSVEARFDPWLPAQRTADARVAAATASELVAAPVHVFFDGRPLRTLARIELARLLRFEERGRRILVTLDRKRLARVLHPAIAAYERPAIDARFAIDGDRVRVVPAQPGIGLDDARALDEVVAAAYSPDVRVADVRVHEVPAAVTTEELAALGITRKLSSFTTQMGESSANRIWNVHLMADYIDGTIVRPGETFSFNRAVGPRTEKRGFREGQMIVGSLLLPSIGGGVCQTATTLFNNAFELGLPIVERHNHSFYISHYPLGRDATVSWGGPDFAFRNDMKNALLIKASYTDWTLTFTFYGTPEGRRVVARTSAQTNWREPSTSYAYDPYAPTGTVRYEEGTNQRGFDVTVSRTVYARDGSVMRRDRFPSQYIPVGPTAVYGPGTTPPRVDFVLPPPES